MKKQLDEKQYKELRELGYEGGPMIGDLVEFLDEQCPISIIGHQSEWHGGKWYWNGGAIPKELTEGAIGKELISYQAIELCDCLWEAVKGVLEK